MKPLPSDDHAIKGGLVSWTPWPFTVRKPRIKTKNWDFFFYKRSFICVLQTICVLLEVTFAKLLPG